ncbi:LmeA family phospholipid-binding protein [Egbenema bharatensis]|uniref:LmeA family phospholipid-binding protein n=1 Tax=Egbenema bharatensis TaxID=3463334 RepID=UPI003A89C5A1
MNDKPDLGEQALDKVAEIAISSQLDEAEEVDVDIRTDPGNLIQGKLNSVGVSGEGMTMKRDLRVEAVQMETDAVAIDPLKSMTGELELTKPLNAKTRILLTETDLNRALKSDYLRPKMQGLEIRHEDKVIPINIEAATVHLQENGQIRSDASLFLIETNERKRLTSTLVPSIKEDGNKIQLEIISAEGEGLSLEFLTVLFEQIVELLDLRNFDLGGNALKLQRIDVRPTKIFLQATATMRKLPK